MASGRAAMIGAFVGAGLGFAAGAAWVGSSAPDRAPDAESVASVAAPADPAPAPQRDGGSASEIARLEAEVALLRGALAEQQAPASAEAGPATETPDAEEDGDFFDGDALEAAGWRTADVDRLRERYEAYELDRLYLQDQATREGWRRSGRYMRELRALREELREELGDADYDAALYAAGRNNRVRIQSLLGDSPAAAAGLRVGDDIVRYAGERIFDPMHLVRLTADGAPGRPVEMRVRRGGQEVRVFLPRGPLGVRLQRISAPPE